VRNLEESHVWATRGVPIGDLLWVKRDDRFHVDEKPMVDVAFIRREKAQGIVIVIVPEVLVTLADWA
jgi:hypothetical protein